jgi:molecular chaperone GrpE
MFNPFVTGSKGKDSTMTKEMTKEANDEATLSSKELNVTAQNEMSTPDLTEGSADQAEATLEPNWEEKYQSLWDQHLRLAADFDNFRKRFAQERELLRKSGIEATLHALIPALDNLERAQKTLSETADSKLLYQSFRLVSKQLNEGLGSLGMQRINAVGQLFDPNLHEAIARVPSTDHEEHAILDEQQPGYTLDDKVLRPALVVVATAPEA